MNLFVICSNEDFVSRWKQHSFKQRNVYEFFGAGFVLLRVILKILFRSFDE